MSVINQSELKVNKWQISDAEVSPSVKVQIALFGRRSLCTFYRLIIRDFILIVRLKINALMYCRVPTMRKLFVDMRH